MSWSVRRGRSDRSDLRSFGLSSHFSPWAGARPSASPTSPYADAVECSRRVPRVMPSSWARPSTCSPPQLAVRIWQAALGTTLMLIVAGVGTIDAFWVRQQLDPSPVIRLSGQESAIAWATARMRLRDEARQLLEVNPRLADELHIGRPDLPHRFDDGGLVDADRASAAALATAPGIDASLADRIVATRGSIRGFESLEDLSIALDIPPQILDSARDFLVFRQ